MVGSLDASTDPAIIERIKTRRRSVNDKVRDDMKRLLGRTDLSADDRRRLDLHLTSIREVEVKLLTGLTVHDGPR